MDEQAALPLTAALAEAAEQDRDQACLDSALRFLANRPRSEREIRRRLAEKGYEPDRVDRVIEKLIRLKLVDDRMFAEYWLENRALHRPKGVRALRAELFAKGVGREVVEGALEGERDEPEDAYRAAQRQASRWPLTDETTFKQRLSLFLQRRGFGWEAIEAASNRLWDERSGG